MTRRPRRDRFDFGDHKAITIPVTGPIDKKEYVLTEASEDASKHFDNARGRCAHFKDGGLSGVDGLGDMPQVLLHMTLFEANDDGSPDTKRPISRRDLARWPTRYVKPLFAEVLYISEIDDDTDLATLKKQREELSERIAKMEEDAAKNAPSDMETGSSLPESEAIADL